MSWHQRLIEWLDDALNPIVVKELRQAVRGRFLAGILIFFLALQLATLGIFLLSKGISSIDLVGGATYGEDVFGILVGILFFAAVFCIPIYTAVRMASERSNDGMALFYVSTLAPRRIIAGKLAASLVLVLLLFSACLPYLSFTYFLRGIDLPTIFIALGVGLVAAAVGIQMAILLASLSVSRVLRILIGLAGLGALLMLFIMSMTIAMRLPQIGVGSRLGSWTFWGPALLALVPMVLGGGLVFAMSVAIITHAAANRAVGVRVFGLVAWLLTTAGAAFGGLIEGETDVVVAWLYLAMLLLALSLLPAICARDRMSVRVAGEVPRSPTRRFMAFFFFSGSINGVAWSVAMIAATYAVAKWIHGSLAGSGLRQHPEMLLGLCGYVFSYAMLALILQRGPLRRWIQPNHTWVIALTLIAAFSLVPPITGFLLAPDVVARSLDFGLWLIMNPFSPFNDGLSDVAIRFGLGWAAVMAILVNGWFRQQVAAFRPPESSGDPAQGLAWAADPQAEG